MKHEKNYLSRLQNMTTDYFVATVIDINDYHFFKKSNSSEISEYLLERDDTLTGDEIDYIILRIRSIIEQYTYSELFMNGLSELESEEIEY